MTFTEQFIRDFESDFVLDVGTIVDNPDDRWSPLTTLYKKALEEIVKEIKLIDRINSIIALDGEDYADGEIINMIAVLTGYNKQ